jgi:hypothetical protein
MQHKFLLGEDCEHIFYYIDNDQTLDHHWQREANHDAEGKYFAEDYNLCLLVVFTSWYIYIYIYNLMSSVCVNDLGPAACFSQYLCPWVESLSMFFFFGNVMCVLEVYKRCKSTRDADTGMHIHLYFQNVNCQCNFIFPLLYSIMVSVGRLHHMTI